MLHMNRLLKRHEEGKIGRTLWAGRQARRPLCLPLVNHGSTSQSCASVSSCMWKRADSASLHMSCCSVTVKHHVVDDVVKVAVQRCLIYAEGVSRVSALSQSEVKLKPRKDSQKETLKRETSPW